MDRIRKLEAKVASLERQLEAAQGSIVGLLNALRMQHRLNIHTATNLGTDAAPQIQAHFLAAKSLAHSSATAVQTVADLRRPIVRHPFVRGRQLIAREMVRGMPRVDPQDDPAT